MAGVGGDMGQRTEGNNSHGLKSKKRPERITVHLSINKNYMIPEKAIKIAIENGWYPTDGNTEPVDWNYKHGTLWAYEADGTGMCWTDPMIVQTPLFWQALGKGLGWDVSYGVYGHRAKYPGSVWDSHGELYFHGTLPNYYALRYFELLLTNGDLNKFWDEILTN